MNQPSDVLIERLERLERSNRRLKLLSLVVLAAIGTMGAAQGIPHTFDTLNAKQINAEGISIVDANGKLRVSIGADPTTDQGGMAVFQRDGITRVTVGAGPTGNVGGVTVFQGDGVTRAALGVGTDNTAGMGLFDSSGPLRVGLNSGAGPTDGATAAVFDPSGTARTVMTAAPEGFAIVATFEPDFGPLSTYSLTVPNGVNGVFVNDASGNLRTDIFTHQTLTGFEVRTPSDVPVIGLSSNPDGTSQNLAMTGPNGIGGPGMNVNSGPGGVNQVEFVGISASDGTLLASMDSAPSGDGQVRTFFANGTESGHLP